MTKLTAQELAHVWDIYEEIAAEPWFNRNAVTERELIKLIVQTCSEQSGEPGSDRQLCREAAQARFGKLR